MIGWLIILGYLVVGVVTWRVMYCIVYDHPDYGREEAIGFGAFGAVGWPLTLIGLVLWKVLGGWVTSPTPKQRRKLHEKQLEEELRELKRVAREHGLPL